VTINFKSNQISLPQLTTHYIWLDRQVVTPNLYLPIKTKPKRKNKNHLEL